MKEKLEKYETTKSMKISFRCPLCGGFLQGDKMYSGQWIECPFCSNIQVMPDLPLIVPSEHYGYNIKKISHRNSVWTTYKAVSQKDGKNVIIKIIENFFKKSISDFSRFCEKIIELDNLHLPYSPRLIEFNPDLNSPFFVFSDFENSRSLAGMIRDEGLVSEEDALDIAVVVASALQEIYETASLSHSCLNPKFIRFSPSLDIMIYELGIYEFLAQDEQLKNIGFNVLKAAFLHPNYMSSEQIFLCHNLQYDIYAVANIIFLILNRQFSDTLLPKNINEPLFSERELENLSNIPSVYKKLLIRLVNATSRESWENIVQYIIDAALEYEKSKKEVSLLMSVINSIPDIPEEYSQTEKTKNEFEAKASIAELAKLKLQERKQKKSGHQRPQK